MNFEKREAEKFQFLIGSLEAKDGYFHIRGLKTFQFLIGSLEAEDLRPERAHFEFQFLIGSLEALTLAEMQKYDRRFNSS